MLGLGRTTPAEAGGKADWYAGSEAGTGAGDGCAVLGAGEGVGADAAGGAAAAPKLGASAATEAGRAVWKGRPRPGTAP